MDQIGEVSIVAEKKLMIHDLLPSISVDLILRQLNTGQFGLDITADQNRISTIAARRQSRETKQIKEFSSKARRRFMDRLLATNYNLPATWLITLKFPDETAPKQARAFVKRYTIMLRSKFKGCFGDFIAEFNRSGEIHYHLIICVDAKHRLRAEEYSAELKRRWCAISGLPSHVDFYVKNVNNINDVTAYLCKDDQKVIPERWRGRMTTFSGYFGTHPTRILDVITLPEDQQQKVRGMLADIISSQNTARSFPFSEAVRHSTSDICIRLSASQFDRLIQWLKTVSGYGKN